MPKIAYFDCFAGASGDMILGAILDVLRKIPSSETETLLDLWLLQMDSFLKLESHASIKLGETNRKGIKAFKVDFFIANIHADHAHHMHKHSHHHRHLKDIYSILEGAVVSGDYPEDACKLSKNIFYNLAHAEAKAHKCSIEEVHFHEVGAFDSIMDIAGISAALNLLSPDLITCSPISTGTGKVETEHGLLDVPPPAVRELITALKIKTSNIILSGECLTPTGAATLGTIASEWKNEDYKPPQKNIITGNGAGNRNPEEIANLVKLNFFTE